VDSYRAGNIIYRRAVEQDDAVLRAMLRDNAMDSWVVMSLERDPCYFDADNLMGESATVIAQQADKSDHAVGMYNYALLPVHIDGKPVQASYLGGLRVQPDFRHKLSILKHGFASIGQLGPESTMFFTSVASENALARRLLEKPLQGMPRYRPEGEMETLAIAVRQARSSGLLQPAVAADIPALVEFSNRQSSVYQFSPHITESWLLGLTGAKGLRLSDFWLLKDGPEVRGCLAVWDQRAFKQTVARAYHFPLDVLRPAYNLWAGLAGRIKLPAPGQRLEQAFLAFVAFDDSVENVMLQALREGLAMVRNKGAAAGVVGFSSCNPLLTKLKNAMPFYAYRSCIESVALAGQSLPPLDGRAPQPEVALL
jgi:hypothetical protein